MTADNINSQTNLNQPGMPQAVPKTSQTVVPTEEVTSTTPAKKGIFSNKKRFSKIILIIVSLLLLLTAVFLVIRFLLPRLRESTRETSLTWWGLWEDEAIVAPLIAEYEQSHQNVKINYLKQSAQDYRERLTNALARGDGPDIFRFHNTWVPMFKSELDFVPPSVVSAGEFSQIYYPVVSSDLTSGAGLVGIPLECDGLGFFVNEDIFNSAGKSIPRTWDDLRQTARELTIKDENGFVQQAGVALGRTENVDHWPEILALMMLQNGVKLSNPQGRLAEDALAYFTIFSSVDDVWDESLPPSTVAFASGKVAMYFGPSWRVFEIKQQNPNLNFKVLPVPQLPRETPNEQNISYASYWAEGVWKRSKSREVAWDFLKFLSSKESLQKLYQNASKVRTFGEPYPRVDMAQLLFSDSLVGAFVSQAPDAQTWFLQSRTFDGPTGINSQINKYFEDAINAVNSGTRPNKALETVVSGVNQVLSTYGLISPAGY